MISERQLLLVLLLLLWKLAIARHQIVRLIHVRPPQLQVLLHVVHAQLGADLPAHWIHPLGLGVAILQVVVVAAVGI